MTESDWLTATDPQEMLSLLKEEGLLSGRKAKLFAVACCRSIWGEMAKESSRRLVDAVERLADAEATTEEVETTWEDAATDSRGAADRLADDAALAAAFQAVRGNAISNPMTSLARYTVMYATNLEAGERSLAGLLRCTFDSPFRPLPPLSPSVLEWQGGLVVRLAEAAYEHRLLPSGHLDPDRLAVLADALEDAGCDDAVLLGHLRSEGPHVRGCFALDAVLGRE